MPFAPIRISGGKLRQPGASVAIICRHGVTYVDFRISADTIKRLGWTRAKRVEAHADTEHQLLMFTESAPSNPNSRALQFEGGHQLRVRFPRLSSFADLVPLIRSRQAVGVVECGKGQLILDCSRLGLATAA